MKKQFSVESEGLGPLGGVIGGGIRGVNDSTAYLVDDFKPTLCELAVLTGHYLGNLREIEFGERFYATSGSYEIRMGPFADRRLATIEDVLGKERFQKAIASTEEKWDKIFAEALEFEKNLAPCTRCGARRTYADYVHCSEGYCGKCPEAEARGD